MALFQFDHVDRKQQNLKKLISRLNCHRINSRIDHMESDFACVIRIDHTGSNYQSLFGSYSGFVECNQSVILRNIHFDSGWNVDPLTRIQCNSIEIIGHKEIDACAVACATVGTLNVPCLEEFHALLL